MVGDSFLRQQMAQAEGLTAGNLWFNMDSVKLKCSRDGKGMVLCCNEV